jgi:transposase/5-methylcytosine-specific restriction endonuclease McrA
MDKQPLELLLGEGLSVERIAKRFGKDPSTVSYWMNKHGLVSPYREKHAAKGGIERERLEGLVNAGMTIAEIATEVGLSKGTARHWLRRYGLRTQNGRGRRRHGGAPAARAVRAARAAGQLTVVMPCARHGETEFVLEDRGYYRCKRCRVDAVVRHRRKIKARLVEEAGGRCCVCGYDRYVGALQFHHVDPDDKLYEVSQYGVTLSVEAARAEATKCVLLCANCHAEVETGATRLPARVRLRPLGPMHHKP